jgi:3-deoxy-D-manno-octulosonate cytidylyltransferase
MLKLLDCTLRDGGYINNWNFSDSDINYIISKLIQSNVDIIELGYFDPINGKEYNSTRFSNLNNLKYRFNLIEDQDVVVMVNCDFEIIKKLPEQSGTSVDGIRLAFHRGQINKIIELSKLIKSKGYELYLNPMVTSSFSTEEIKKLIEVSNIVNPKAIYIVDSFGSIDLKKIQILTTKFNKELNEEISVGFHPHNNLQLAFSNSIGFISIEMSRNQIIDCSVLGMGRGAGNLNTELIIPELNKNYNKNYKFNLIINIIEIKLKFLKQKYNWGYAINYLLSGINDCHPNYSKYLLDQDRFNYNEMNKILSSLNKEEKIRYSEKIIKEKVKSLFLNNNTVNEFNITGEEIILIGPGILNSNQISSLNKIIESKKALTVSLNHKSIIETNFYFFSNLKRLDEFIDSIDNSKIITLEAAINTFDIAFENIISPNKIYKNKNAFIVFVNFLIESGFKKVYVAGIDGYLNKKEYSFNSLKKGVDDIIENEINITTKFLKEIKDTVEIKFLTPSRYENRKVVGVIPARYSSSRFDGKPLAKINGVEMIKRTYNQVKKAKLLDQTFVATDSFKILEFCNKEKINCVLTDDNCITGTDRVINFKGNFQADIYINIQGDEPVIDPRCIDDLILEMDNDKNYDVFNMYKKIEDDTEKNSSSIIKVVLNDYNELLYMSRANIPSNKNNLNENLFKQVCVYGYRKTALEKIKYNQKSKIEKIEDIEILRFLESNIKVKMIETNYSSISVDHPSDILKVESFLQKNKSKNV